MMPDRVYFEQSIASIGFDAHSRTPAPSNIEQAISNLVTRVRLLREKSGMGQRAIARQLGISKSSYARLETGEQPPSIKQICKLEVPPSIKQICKLEVLAARLEGGK